LSQIDKLDKSVKHNQPKLLKFHKSSWSFATLRPWSNHLDKLKSAKDTAGSFSFKSKQNKIASCFWVFRL